ncbi:hypothetical protein BC629DRAFT_1470833 [Irpex lacteus]|nr:hypothetical protein BC629DRAFT_1470833 [Irpex lacteus]
MNVSSQQLSPDLLHPFCTKRRVLYYINLSCSLRRPQPLKKIHRMSITSRALSDAMGLPPIKSDEASQVHHLLDVSTIILEQGIDLLENYLTNDEQLTVNSKFVQGSTIGKHLRHARDHFMLLLDAMAVSSPPYIVNYDVRIRGQPMETSIKAAHEALTECVERLRREVPKLSVDEPLTLNAVTPYPQTFQSTFGRELWFAGLHAEHHWSMVRVHAGELGIRLPESFGFAPSTLVHHGTEAPLGKAKI